MNSAIGCERLPRQSNRLLWQEQIEARLQELDNIHTSKGAEDSDDRTLLKKWQCEAPFVGPNRIK